MTAEQKIIAKIHETGSTKISSAELRRILTPDEIVELMLSN